MTDATMMHRKEESPSSSSTTSITTTLEDDVTRVVDWLSSLSPLPPNDTASSSLLGQSSSSYEVSLDRLCHDWSRRSDQENDTKHHHSRVISRSVAAVLLSRALVVVQQSLLNHDHPPETQRHSATTTTTTMRTTTCHTVSYTVPATKSDHYKNHVNHTDNNDHDETVPCTVFSLRTQNYGPSQDDAEPAVIVAATFDRSSTTLDHNSTASVRLGHANDMLRWRTAFAQPRQFLAQTTSHPEWKAPYHADDDDANRPLSSPRTVRYIVPAPIVQAALRYNSTMTAPAATQPPPVAHRTTTTTTKPPTTTTTGATTTTTTTTTAAKFFGARASQKEDGKENTGNSMTTTPQPRTHFTKPAAVTKMIGNADDFIGDLDDDDDEMDVENVIDIPPPRATKKRHHRINNHDDDDDDVTMTIPDDNDAKVKTGVVHGAMDAFVTTATTAPGALHPRRVKVMTTQTVRDEHGYLVSRQVEEWRDISNDAAAEASLVSKTKSRPSQPITTSKTTGTAATTKSKKSSTAPNAMKQKSLKGFFTKK